MDFEYNPFHDAGITNYEQYKLYPFLIFGTLDTIKNRITQQIKQIKSGHFFFRENDYSGGKRDWKNFFFIFC